MTAGDWAGVAIFSLCFAGYVAALMWNMRGSK